MKKLLMTACAALATIVPTVAQATYTTPDTEMRSAWIATVYRLDWPCEVISTTGSTSQINRQKRDLTRMLDSMAVNNMNAAKLQIRSRCDALYMSSYEPWSSEIVSRRGMDPGYDPFEFFVQECHSRSRYGTHSGARAGCVHC
ncbi:MAG: family 10 glycosylhydrolase [Muribaculaceae bacterium]